MCRRKTLHRLYLKLDFYFAVSDKNTAFKFEKYLKSGSGRAFVNKHLLSNNPVKTKPFDAKTEKWGSDPLFE